MNVGPIGQIGGNDGPAEFSGFPNLHPETMEPRSPLRIDNRLPSTVPLHDQARQRITCRLAAVVAGAGRELAHLAFLGRVDSLGADMENIRIPIVEAARSGREAAWINTERVTNT